MTSYPHGKKGVCGLNVKYLDKPHTHGNQKGELMSDPTWEYQERRRSYPAALVIFLKHESESTWESLVSRVLNLGFMPGFQSIFQPWKLFVKSCMCAFFCGRKQMSLSEGLITSQAFRKSSSSLLHSILYSTIYKDIRWN